MVILQCIRINAQKNIYDFVKPGDYQVGFYDTLILDEKYDYKAYDYKGQKPYFVKIWHTDGHARSSGTISATFHMLSTFQIYISP